jgi:uncharacterized membrane protein YedE/YeeE
MIDALADRPHWLVSGCLLGLLVAGLLWAVNRRLGVSGGFAEIGDRLARRTVALGPSSFFVFGIVGGAVVFGLLGGGFRAGDSYGWLAEHGSAVTAASLLGGGILIGVGTRSAGGCTSGHGICGTALGSRASFVATAVFMATAIAAAFVLDGLG